MLNRLPNPGCRTSNGVFSFSPQATSVMVAFEEIAEQYVTATGDTAGVKTVNGSVVLDCWQDSAVRVYGEEYLIST